MNEGLFLINFTGVMAIFCWLSLWLFGWQETKKAGGKFFWDFPRNSENIVGMDIIFIGLIMTIFCIFSSIDFIF